MMGWKVGVGEVGRKKRTSLVVGGGGTEVQC